MTGIAALLPLMLTVFLLAQCWKLLSEKVGTPINRAIKTRLSTESGKRILQRHFGWSQDVLDSKELFRKELDKQFPAYVGIAAAVLIVIFGLYTIGFLVATFLGRRLFRLTERLLVRFPVIKVIYPYAKQITDFFFSGNKPKFTRVVAVEYPRKGLYSLAFLTGDGLRKVADAAGRKMVNVFIPSSPTPVTGYVIVVPADEVIPLDMTVEEAFRFSISGGVLVPSAGPPAAAIGSDTQLPPPSDDDGSPSEKQTTSPNEEATST